VEADDDTGCCQSKPRERESLSEIKTKVEVGQERGNGASPSLSLYLHTKIIFISFLTPSQSQPISLHADATPHRHLTTPSHSARSTGEPGLSWLASSGFVFCVHPPPPPHCQSLIMIFKSYTIDLKSFHHPMTTAHTQKGYISIEPD
jgi:hypothetical protein